jgi:hypothetical protein
MEAEIDANHNCVEYCPLEGTLPAYNVNGAQVTNR